MSWFDTPGRSDREEAFLVPLRDAGPRWLELGIDGPHAGVVYCEDGPLMAYVDLCHGGLTFATLRIDFHGESIVAGLSDGQMAEELDRGARETVSASGGSAQLAAAAAEWLDGQLRRPVEAWEWSSGPSFAGRLGGARAFVFADTGESLLWQSIGLRVLWQVGGMWGQPPTMDRLPDRVESVRPDRRVCSR